MQKLGFSGHIIQKAKNDLRAILVIIAVWTLMIILVNPIGDFPLNDDWAYGYSVKVLLTHGHFRLSGWTAANLASQVFWGAIFCLPFGFSFTALRFSTLTLGLIGVVAVYFILKEMVSLRKTALLGALLVAINPIYFALSNTFMNDVPFTAFATVSICFLARGLKKNSRIEITIGMITSYIAIMTRQVGLAIPLAFGCAYIIKRGISFSKFLFAGLPALLGFGIQFCYQKWLQWVMQQPIKFNNQVKTILSEISKGVGNVVDNFFSIILFALLYLGLFLFPYLLIYFAGIIGQISHKKRILMLAASAALFLIITITLLSQYGFMPVHGNILGDFGIGPVILKGSRLPKAPDTLRLVVTAISAIGAVLLFCCVFLAVFKIAEEDPLPVIQKERWLAVLFLSAVLIYSFPLILLGLGPFGFYDRYLIFLLPLLMMFLSTPFFSSTTWNAGKKSFSLAIIVMLLYGGFTIGATHDYLSLNRVRWRALHDLMDADQISPDDIDGGFEFNGWYLYDSQYEYDPTFVKSWYWVQNDRYVVSLGPIAGYREVRRYPFRRWLPFGGPGNIIVLQKKY